MSAAAPPAHTDGFILNFPIAKIDEERREVWGFATTETVDQQGEIVDYEASKRAFAEWTQFVNSSTGGKSLGNVREMHQPKAVGSVIAWQPDDQRKAIWVGAKLSRSADGESAWMKIKEGVLNGFSIGAPFAERAMQYANGKMVRRVTNYKLSELSVVDNPACPDSFFQMVKSGAGSAGPVMLSKALGEIDADATPRGIERAQRGLSPNAYVDSQGQVWKLEGGLASPSITKKESAMSKEAAAESVEKAGKKIGPQQQPQDTKAPGVEKPSVEQGNEAKNVKPAKNAEAGVNEGEPGGPHEIATDEVKVPDGQGKAADACMHQQPMAQAQPPAPPMQQPMAPQRAPLPPQQGAPSPMQSPASRYQFCAMCGQKFASASGEPFHAACKDAASKAVDVEDLKKSFSDGLSGIQKAVLDKIDAMASMNAGLLERIERLEKTPLPGGPARTELPSGVAPVEKAARMGGEDDSIGLIEKAAGAIRDPFTRDAMLREVARAGIKKAQTGR